MGLGGTVSVVENPQSVVVQEGDGVNGDVRRHAKYADKLIDRRFPEVSTLYDSFNRAVEKWPERVSMSCLSGVM